MPLNTKKKPVKLVETVFDVLYLATVLVSGVLLCRGAAAGSERLLFGVMALVLFAGDAFHLLPRVSAMWSRGGRSHTAAMGAGKFAASLTMTAFYVLLWHIGLKHYPEVSAARFTAAIYVLAAVRAVLCLLPSNRWLGENAPLRWAVWRNIPFFILGMAVAALFAAGATTKSDGLAFVWPAVLISFACYLPVVLFSRRSPKVGMLMLPKSCAYAAVVLTGFTLAAG